MGRRATNFARRFLERKRETETVKTFSIFADWVLIRELCLGGFIARRNLPWPHLLYLKNKQRHNQEIQLIPLTVPRQSLSTSK